MAYNEVMLLIVKNVRYIGKYKSEKSTETVQSDISIPVQPNYKNTVLPIDDGTEKKPDVSYRYNEEHNSWDEVYSLENVSMIYDTAGSDTCPIYKTDTTGRKSCDEVFCFSYIKYIFFLYDRLQ